LSFATVLTLVISPVMYMITIRINYLYRKWTGTLAEVNKPVKLSVGE